MQDTVQPRELGPLPQAVGLAVEPFPAGSLLRDQDVLSWLLPAQGET